MEERNYFNELIEFSRNTASSMEVLKIMIESDITDETTKSILNNICLTFTSSLLSLSGIMIDYVLEKE